ncbi:SEN1 Helicase SEN1 [Candida maltosa Xu316]
MYQEEQQQAECQKIVALIHQSSSEPGNSPIHGQTIKLSVDYLKKYKDVPHWYCDPLMYPIASYALILFSFANNPILEELKPRMVDSLSKCTTCMQGFARGKCEIRLRFAVQNKTPIANVNQFINTINTWEASIVEPKLDEVYRNLAIIESYKEKLNIVVHWCMGNTDLMRNFKNVKDKFNRITYELQNKNHLPIPKDLLPGLIYLIFESQHSQAEWANKWLQDLQKRGVKYDTKTLQEPIVLEFSHHLYKIQDPKYFNENNAIKFWNAFYDIIDFVNDEAFILRMNTPKDIIPMSEFTNIRLYPLIRVLCNSLMSRLTSPLPVLLRVFNKLLSRLQTKFWNHTMGIDFIHFINELFSNPEYVKQLLTAPDEKGFLHDYCIADFTRWIERFILSLNQGQRLIASSKLGPFFLKQTANDSAPSKRVTELRELGCQLLLSVFKNVGTDKGIREENFMVDMSSNRGLRADIDHVAENIVNLAFDQSHEAHATELIARCLKYDISLLIWNSALLLKNEVPTTFDTFPLLWQTVSKSKIYYNVKFSKEVIKCFRLMSMTAKFDEIKTVGTKKDLINARSQHNANMDTITTLQNNIFASFSLGDPRTIKEILGDYTCLQSIWACIYSPSVSQAALDFVNEVYNASGRLETFQECLSKDLGTSLVAINANLKQLTQLKCYETTSRAVRITMDVFKALADPVDSALASSTETVDSSLTFLWKCSWKFLIMIFNTTFDWAALFHLSDLQEFARDTLDLAHLLLDSYRIILDSFKKQDLDDSRPREFVEIFVEAFKDAVKWLKLGDPALLNSCVELVLKGLNFALEERYQVPDSFIEDITKYAKKVKGHNNKLSAQQRVDLLEKAREVNSELVAQIEDQYNQVKKPVPKVVQEIKPEEFASRKFGSMKQQSLSRFMNITEKAPVAPPPKVVKGTQNIQNLRQDLQKIRSAAPIKAPAPPRAPGFNSKGARPVVKKRTTTDSESSSDDSEDDDDDHGIDSSDLFVRPKITQIDMNMRVVKKNELQRRRNFVDEKKAAEQRLQMRLNVNLKPLYLSVLKWNYNSTSEYPNTDKYQYQQVKDKYKDVKEYVQVTEPLLMLECWQAMQSAKKTVDEKPFDILVGTRSSVDGFFDVFASIEKSILQDRKIGESDLLVLALKNEAMNDPAEVRRYMKAESTTTILAKVREIKYTNSDFVDLTVRVFPQGSLLGALTPKSVVTGMRVMQMVTIEREFSSLKGLEYYDLADEIISATPNKPIDISDQEAENMRQIYSVNESQAKAIMGTYKSEGFSLIQGPPGTGKTKTILGIVGYSLSQHKNEKTIDIPGASPAPTSSSAKILICAPSNAAVDELVLRLRDGVRNSSGKHMPLKVVRLGRSDAINAAVRDLTLEELVDAQLKNNEIEVTIDPNIRKEHTKCIEERDALRNRLRTESLSEKESAELEDQLHKVNKKRSELAKRLDNQRENVSIANRTKEINRRNIQAKILSEAQVLCATLSGSAHDLVANLRVQFDQVIIDEACQCLELSAIIPLRYGCKKCIMVGDPNQLPPTVLSQAAASFNYEQSLFVRMQQNHPDSVYMLNVQYRMHPMISEFPSAEFYQSKLKDGDNMAAINTRPWHQISPLTPYRFFDILGKHEKNELTRSLFNLDEAKVALQLTEQLMKIIPQNQFSGKVGIISPYKEQIRTIKDVFVRTYGRNILDEIDFNTVDGFQGQEKEIIIMSCVRASPTGNVGFLSDIRRMNVALTRARTTLWILGNKDSLSRNKVWNELLTDAQKRDCITKAYPGFLNVSNPDMKRKVDDIKRLQVPNKRANTNFPQKPMPAPKPIPPQPTAPQPQAESTVQRIRNNANTARPTSGGYLPSKNTGTTPPLFEPKNVNKNINHNRKPYISSNNRSTNEPQPYSVQPKPQQPPKVNGPTRSGTIARPPSAGQPKDGPTTNHGYSHTPTNSGVKPPNRPTPSSSGVVKPPSSLFIPRKKPGKR